MNVSSAFGPSLPSCGGGTGSVGFGSAVVDGLVSSCCSVVEATVDVSLSVGCVCCVVALTVLVSGTGPVNFDS